MECSHSHSASRYVCAALLVCAAALHAYMHFHHFKLQLKCVKTVASLDDCQVKVIVSSCFCLYALQACLNLLRCLLMQ